MTVVALGTEYQTIYEGVLGEFEPLLELASEADPPLMLFDLKHTNHVGSAFLGFLLRISNRITQNTAGRLGVCHLSTFCETIFSTTMMELICERFDTKEAALIGLTTASPNSP